MADYATDYRPQRDSGRERSPRRRSRSPRRARRSYSPRSRSRSREDYRRADRRSRSPMSGAQAGGYNAYGSGRGSAPRNEPVKDMQSIRESSQQDRRVYVGNLSYDVKWHHLKDFMRQGMFSPRPPPNPPLTSPQPERSCSQTYCFCPMACQRYIASDVDGITSIMWTRVNVVSFGN